MSRRSRQIQQEIESRWPKIGSVVKADNCCREIRLGASSYKEGEEVEGWNTDTDIFEKWIVVKLTKDKLNPLMKRLR